MSVCIHETNPAGGFAASHGVLCAHECSEAANRHLHLGYWCGNVCEKCCKKKLGRTQGGGIVLQELRGIAPVEPPEPKLTVKRPYMRHPPCAIECRCDGDQVYALIGDSTAALTGQPGGVIAFGDTLADALRKLADEIEKEVEVTTL